MQDWLRSLWNSPEGLTRVFYWTQWATVVFGVLTALAIALSVIVSRRKDDLLATVQLQTENQRESENAERDRQIAAANEAARRAHEAEVQAESRLAAIEERQAPRIFSEKQKSLVSAFLQHQSKGAFTIKANISVSDARSYADQITTMFRQNGWNVQVDNAIITGGPAGIWITVRDLGTAMNTVATIQEAFKNAGISVPIAIDPKGPGPSEIWLSVSSK